jgi:hypothetical protein
MRLLPFWFALALPVVGWSGSAQACGGCFAPPPNPDRPGETTLVTAHRMAISISPTQTVLWDQFRYSGAPQEFAWVLPIRPGARLELASDAWLDVLEAATTPRVERPVFECDSVEDSCGPPATGAALSGCGQSSDEAAISAPPDDDPVQIVSRESAGPYESVVLRASDPEALPQWLDERGYDLPDDVVPLVTAYASEGFDFIALRLLPGAGVSQMRPVRVVQPGASFALPLRMIAAGTGARTPLSLFVIAAGRYEPTNFDSYEIPRNVITWDFETDRSNYADLRDSAFALDEGRTWITSYALRGALFDRIPGGPQGLFRSVATTNGWRYERLSDAYVAQAFANGESSEIDCIDRLAQLGSDHRKVVDPCGDDGVCADVDPDSELDVRDLGCTGPIGSDSDLDDLAVALVGQRPSDVWITRLDANLPRAALDLDLELGAASEQTPVSGSFEAEFVVNSPCDDQAAVAAGQARRDREEKRRGLGLVGLVAGALVVARRVARRTLRRKEVAS